MVSLSLSLTHSPGIKSVSDNADPSEMGADRVRDNALARLENLESNRNQMAALR
jgi:hypothetical protein